MQLDTKYIDDTNVVLQYRLPWQEVVTDLHDVVRRTPHTANTHTESKQTYTPHLCPRLHIAYIYMYI